MAYYILGVFGNGRAGLSGLSSGLVGCPGYRPGHHPTPPIIQNHFLKLSAASSLTGMQSVGQFLILFFFSSQSSGVYLLTLF
jgi:hypothetical protein